MPVVAGDRAQKGDPFLVGASVSREINYLARDDLFRFPVIGWLLRQWPQAAITAVVAPWALIAEWMRRYPGTREAAVPAALCAMLLGAEYAFGLRRDFPWKRALGYIVMQLLGATLAVLLLWAIFGREGKVAGTASVHATEAKSAADEPRVPYRRILLNGTWLGGFLAGFAAFALCETNRRPSVVEAQSVPASADER